MFRTCSLAVLNCGSDIDDARQLQQKFSSFKIKALQVERGLWLELHNAPAIAFVEGKMIKGIKEHLFSVLRDIIYVNNEISNNPRFNLRKSKGTTDTIFHILRNAGTLRSRIPSNTVVFCGGHSIERHEYDYTKDVGYELGLRGMDICTGCGAGAIKGPMKGATIGHGSRPFTRKRVGFGRDHVFAASLGARSMHQSAHGSARCPVRAPIALAPARRKTPYSEVAVPLRSR